VKAKYLKTLKGFSGTAKLYELSPPLIEKDYEGKPRGKHKYVVVSAAVAMFSGSETYIFPATKSGEIKNFGELDGSYRGGLDHETALRNAGYSIS
jgi:hypothetical protein